MTNIVNFNLRVIVGNQEPPLNYLEVEPVNLPPVNGGLVLVTLGPRSLLRNGVDNAGTAGGW